MGDHRSTHLSRRRLLGAGAAVGGASLAPHYCTSAVSAQASDASAPGPSAARRIDPDGPSGPFPIP